jgi:hypothetical protein
MARYVRLTIIYDMDDMEKTLAGELRDWVLGNVSVGDLFDEREQPRQEGDEIHIVDITAEKLAEEEYSKWVR